MTLRILYFGTYDRGVGRNAVLIDGLRASGVEVHECHSRLWLDTADKIGAVQRPQRAVRAAARLMRSWRALAWRHARAGRYDALLVGATAHLDLPLAAVLAGLRRREVVFDPLVSMCETIRDRGLLSADSFRMRLLTHLERALFKLPDICLVDSTAHARAFARELGLSAEQVIVLPAGAPRVYRTKSTPYEPNTGHSPVRVLYFGQYIPLHGLDTVILAARSLAGRSDITFELIGRGQMLQPTRALADRLALPNVVFRDEWLAPDVLAEQHIRRADICLGAFGSQPKVERVVPYKVYTALASGRACVTSDTEAVREFLVPGTEVCTVPPAQPDALAAAIQRLADAPATRSSMARAGQLAYDERFAPAVIGAALRDELAVRLRQRSDEQHPRGPR